MFLTEEGFKFTLGTDGKRTLLFDTDREAECCDFFIRAGLKKISIYPGIYKASNLKPLMPLVHHVEGLLMDDKLDYSYLNEFIQLKSLSLPDNGKDTVNLNNFILLETLSTKITKRLTGLEKCPNLKVLIANNYKSSTNDLASVPKIDTLEYLVLTQSTITDLRGIDQFMNLKRIQLYGLSKLTTIGALKEISKNLINLEIEKCKKISDYDALGNLTRLDKLIITESGNIKSLNFITNLNNLKFFSFWGTNVLDGNIDYCKGIDFVGFDNKRHYNRKVHEFKK